jgi:AmpE protein
LNFLALILGLLVERLLTSLFHLREFRWLDGVFDAGLVRMKDWGAAATLLGVTALCLLLAAPVALIAWLLGGALLDIPYFVFAIVVLLLSLGPRDLKAEVDDYCEALGSGDEERVRRASKELIETSPSSDPDTRSQDVEAAVFLQANNRIFGVVFWFAVLGPVGAWLFRVVDLMRRRSAFSADRHDGISGHPGAESSLRILHGVLAWVPARILAGGYVLGGSFEHAVADWRRYRKECQGRFFELTSELLACVGRGAVGPHVVSDNGDQRVAAAMALVGRTLWFIWCPVLAILTLYNFLG